MSVSMEYQQQPDPKAQTLAVLNGLEQSFVNLFQHDEQNKVYYTDDYVRTLVTRQFKDLKNAVNAGREVQLLKRWETISKSFRKHIVTQHRQATVSLQDEMKKLGATVPHPVVALDGQQLTLWLDKCPCGLG